MEKIEKAIRFMFSKNTLHIIILIEIVLILFLLINSKLRFEMIVYNNVELSNNYGNPLKLKLSDSDLKVGLNNYLSYPLKLKLNSDD